MSATPTPSIEPNIFDNIGVGIGIILGIVAGIMGIYDLISKKIKKRSISKECTLSINDLHFILTKHELYREGVDKIEFVNILEEQMNSFMRKVERIKTDCDFFYRNALKKVYSVNNEDIDISIMVNSFNIHISAVVNDLIDDFRKLCRQNHFTRHTDQSFKDYVQFNSRTYSRKFITTLQSNFTEMEQLSEETQEQLMSFILETVQTALEDSLLCARTISIEQNKAIQDLTNQFNKDILSKYKIDLTNSKTCSDPEEN